MYVVIPQSVKVLCKGLVNIPAYRTFERILGWAA